MIKEHREVNPDNLYLITGGAGFIGFFLSKKLLELGCRVIGLDNLNDYYDVNLKKSRLRRLDGQEHFTFIKGDISDKETVRRIFAEYRPQIVVNLAAQAGVRYSIDHPDSYIQSNIVGFFNILEACRYHPVLHLIYASSSSVYGANTKVPFSTEDRVDNPVSLYAATKKSNELMAHTYSQLYGIPCTGLRFFTVYGPMGRPDMAYFNFAQKIINGEPIKVFNYGNCCRDFTYIDDIVEAVARVICNPPAKRVDRDSVLDGMQYAVYNIGNNQMEQLTDFITALEKALSKAVGRKVAARKKFLPMQPGDVKVTCSDSRQLEKDFGFRPTICIEEGLQRFADWYVDYYRINK